MADGLRTFARAFAPRPVVYRAMDFRSNEFRNLTGGAEHEPTEANPMIGYRGCFRYTREPDLFALGAASARRGACAISTNLHLMIPFVRTLRELDDVPALVDASALGQDDRDRALDHGRGAVRRVPAAGIRRARNHRRIDRLERSDAADARRRSRQRAVRRRLRRARRSGARRDSHRSSPMPQARTHLLDLRSGAVGAPGIRRAVGRVGIDSISVNVDAIERTRRNIAMAEQRILLEKARSERSAPSADFVV